LRFEIVGNHTLCRIGDLQPLIVAIRRIALPCDEKYLSDPEGLRGGVPNTLSIELDSKIDPIPTAGRDRNDDLCDTLWRLLAIGPVYLGGLFPSRLLLLLLLLLLVIADSEEYFLTAFARDSQSHGDLCISFCRPSWMVVVGQLWNFVASLENLMANGKRDLDSPRFAIALSKAYRRASQRERNQRERSNR
jgi:hypothetical protein